MSSANKPRSKTPRPQCDGCTIYQTGPGCGYLDAEMPCQHSGEKWRWANVAQEEPAPIEEPDQGQLMLF